MGNIFATLSIYPLIQIIELTFAVCKKITGNCGIALVGVSLAIGFLTLPLYIVAEAWQEKERDLQRQMKSQVDRIKETFKGNEQYMMLSTYYSQRHYHPIMSLRSAFGLLIQVPFFTAAYSCLSSMSCLKGASFFFIRDLGAADATFMIGSFPVNVLPIAMTAINIFASAVYLRGLPLRDKIQTYGLAFLFLALLYNSPSGLVVYWTMNNVFSLVKNVFYKLKNPLRTLYFVACAAVTAIIVTMHATSALSLKRNLLVDAALSFVYFIPLFVKLCNLLADRGLACFMEKPKERFALFACSSVSLVLILGLFVPGQLIASSPMEFSDVDGLGSPMFFVWNTFFQATGLCFVWPLMIYLLFRERIRSLMAFGSFVLLVLSLLDIFVFTGNYGQLSKLLVFTTVSSVDSPVKSILLNLGILLAVAVVLCVLLRFGAARVYKYASAFVCAGLLAASVMNISVISKGWNDFKTISGTKFSGAKFDPVFHFSKKGKNVLLIFLDRAQPKYIETLWNECPVLDEEFSGFRLYKNSLACNPSTLMAAPCTYGGYEYLPSEFNAHPEKTLVEKQNESLLVLPRIFSEQGNYAATVTDPSWANYSYVPDLSIFNDYPSVSAITTQGTYLDKWYEEHSGSEELKVTGRVLRRNILWYGIFRISPYALRPAFYNNGSYWAPEELTSVPQDFLASYSVLEFMSRLTDFVSEKNSFISITNAATHEAAVLQPPEYTYSPEIDIQKFPSHEFALDPGYHAQAASLRRLGEFFDYLKKNGVYDNTRIIIYSDHGSGAWEKINPDWTNLYLDGPSGFNPLVMVKDFGEKGSLRVDSETFMPNAEVPYIATRNLGFDAVNPFTGKLLDNEAKKDGILVTEEHLFMPHHSKSSKVFTVSPDSWWRVHGNVFKRENWCRQSAE